MTQILDFILHFPQNENQQPYLKWRKNFFKILFWNKYGAARALARSLDQGFQNIVSKRNSPGLIQV